MGGGTVGQKDGRTDSSLEIPPCVSQDIGPMGLLPKKDENMDGTITNTDTDTVHKSDCVSDKQVVGHRGRVERGAQLPSTHTPKKSLQMIKPLAG